jgi:glycosyltransferase involved in cell wall biosynthesis
MQRTEAKAFTTTLNGIRCIEGLPMINEVQSMKNGKMDFFDVSVVMASRNEENAIKKVIIDIQKVTKGQAEIVVVDGSTDDTPNIAEALGAKVIRQKPQGYGVAVKKALTSASRDIIITVDCDDTYPAKQIPEFVKLIRSGYDVVSGSRINKNNANMKSLNKLGNQLFASVTSFLYGINVTDVTTGMRAYRSEIVRTIDWTENVGLSAELLFRPALRKYKIIEIPIEYSPRIGDTKLNPFTGGAGIFKSILKYKIIGDKK